MIAVDYSTVDKVIEKFNFDRVHQAMVALDWKWGNLPDNEFRVPTIDEIRATAYRLLCEAMREYTCISTGGFSARYDSKTKKLTLQFIVSEWYENVPA